jgi:hypothetical protein
MGVAADVYKGAIRRNRLTCGLPMLTACKGSCKLANSQADTNGDGTRGMNYRSGRRETAAGTAIGTVPCRLGGLANQKRYTRQARGQQNKRGRLRRWRVIRFRDAVADDVSTDEKVRTTVFAVETKTRIDHLCERPTRRIHGEGLSHGVRTEAAHRT